MWKRLRLDQQIFILALGAGLPGALTALWILWTEPYTAKVQWTLSVLILSVLFGLAASVRTRVVVPLQTPVRAPAAGSVLHAGSLGLGGGCVVIDHGQGVVSVLQHLGTVSVREGDAVSTGAIVGLSGQTGLAPEPMLQWRVYLHAVAVDPLVLGLLL